jgi:hypothetical protein
MVEVDMGNDQRLDTADIETDRCEFGAWRSICTLLQTTIDQQALRFIKVKLVTRTGYTAGATVMGKAGIFHTAARSPGQGK